MPNSLQKLPASLVLQYLQRDPSRCSTMVGALFHHVSFGDGLLFMIKTKHEWNFWLRFYTPAGGVFERQFRVNAIRNGSIDFVWLTEAQAAAIQDALRQPKRVEKKIAAPSAPKTDPPLAPPSKPAASQPATTSKVTIRRQLIKCIYCDERVPLGSLDQHIDQQHPPGSAVPKVVSQPAPKLARKPPATADKKTPKGERLPICPYCKGKTVMKKERMEKHIRKVHPGRPIPTTYKTVENLLGDKKKKRRYDRGWGVMRPLSMKTINVSHHRGAVLRRKSY